MDKTLEKKLTVILSTLPENPGCYQFINEAGIIIYVGKAKNLKKRVSSYFHKEHENIKTRIMVRHIRDIRYIVVDTEEDALLLENNLIKEYRPRYNVLLKDDKTYPYIVVTHEPFPRIFLTRNINKDGSNYYGPYASVHMARTMVDMIRNIYPIRTCRLLLNEEDIKKGKFKECLQYHIKRCKAPCIGLQTMDEYRENIAISKDILKGNLTKVSQTLIAKMNTLSENLAFEEAQEIKLKYETIENYRSKSTVVPTLNNVDVYSFDENESSAFINFMHVGDGAITQVYTLEYKKRLEEKKEELLGWGIIELRKRFKSDSKEIIIPFLPDITLEKSNITFTIPKIGDKKRLLELSTKNVKQFKIDKLKRSDKFNPEQRTTRLLTTLQKDLHLNKLPWHIECFDNSNIQGTHPVSACVVFKKGKPSKKDYRLFHIKTVTGPDDYASMKESITRRYKRVLEEQGEMPQLIVIDGGKGQLGIAVEVLEEMKIYPEQATVIGIAERMEEIYYPGDPIPLILDKNSETLRIIQHIRDEAHRFGLTFHQKTRSKAQTASALDNIPGIGDKTKELILRKYKSIKRLRDVSVEELAEVIGSSRANKLYQALHTKEK